MPTIDELLNASNEVATCTVNPDTREIIVPEKYKILGVFSDEKVTRIPFTCPKVVGNNVDLTEYNLYINYQNAIGGNNAYLVDDVTVSGDNITFSWLLSRYVTLESGVVKYSICAKKINGDSISNEWNTTIANGVVIQGLEVTQEIIEDNPDIIETILSKAHTHNNKSVLDKFSEANGKPTYDGKTLGGSDTSVTEANITSALGYKPVAPGDIPVVPTKTSQLTNDSGFLTSHQSLAAYRTSAAQDEIDSGKVDKVGGKGLSTNDYTATAKAKVDAIPANPKYTDTVYDDTALKERVAIIESKESVWDAKLNASELPTAINTALAQAKASGEFDGAGYVLTDADKSEIAQLVIAQLGGQPIFGTVDTDGNITVSGYLADGTYTVAYKLEDGTTINVGSFTIGGETPSYTNLYNSATASINKRVNSSGVLVDAAGFVTTDYIAVADLFGSSPITIYGATNAGSAEHTAYIKGATFYNTANCCISFCNSSKGQVGRFASNSANVKTYAGENGDIDWAKIFNTDSGNNLTNVAYIRFVVKYSDSALQATPSDIIITVDEAIE